MNRVALRSRLLVALACVAVIVVRVGGLHVHMCFDGSEPPLSFHVEDSGIHHLDEAAAGNAHDDREMAPASDLAVKKPYGDFDLSMLAAFCALLLFFITRPRELLPFFPRSDRIRSARTRLRPPLRGPPAPA